MAKRKKVSDLGIVKPAVGLTVGGSILGLGADVAVKAGGSGAGMSAMGSFMGPMGATVGAGLTVGQLKKLQKVSKKTKK